MTGRYAESGTPKKACTRVTTSTGTPATHRSTAALRPTTALTTPYAITTRARPWRALPSRADRRAKPTEIRRNLRFRDASLAENTRRVRLVSYRDIGKRQPRRHAGPGPSPDP